MSSRRLARPVYESYTSRNTGCTPFRIRVVYQASIRLVYRDRDRDRDTPTGVCRNGYFCFPVVDFLHCMKVSNAGASRLPGRVHAMPGENFGGIS